MAPAIAGIPVRVDPSFLLISALIGLTGGSLQAAAVWLVVVFVSVLAHEMGHAVAFRSFGVASSITLYAMGGVTVPARAASLGAARDIAVSVAGPAVGLAIGGLAVLVAPPWDFEAGSLARLGAIYVLWVNVGWSIVNLLPVLPLDGGHVLRSVLHRVFGARGVRAAHVVSLVVLGAGAALAVAAKEPFLAILAFYFGSMNLAALRGDRASRRSPDEETLLKGANALGAGNVEGAEWAGRRLVEQASAPAHLRGSGAELLAWAALATGSVERAREALASAPAEAPPGHLAVACVELAATGRAAVPAVADGLVAGSWLVPSGLLTRLLADAGVLDDVVEHLAAYPDPDRAAAGLARLQEVLHGGGRHEQAAGVGERAFALRAQPVVAFNTACSLARAGRPDDAVAWLERAVTAGWDDAAQLDTDGDLAAVRDHPGFTALRQRLAVRAAG